MTLKNTLIAIEEKLLKQQKESSNSFKDRIDAAIAAKLAAPDSEKKKVEVLTNSINEIESLLKRGISVKTMVELLADDGVYMSVGTFKTTLNRIRKKRKNQGTKTKEYLTNDTKQQTNNYWEKEESENEESPKDSCSVEELNATMRKTPDLAKYETAYKLSKKTK